jgi:phosphohistidine phosphatase SixA
LQTLAARTIRRIVSSPYTRCVETVKPLAAELGIAIEIDDRLAEGASRAHALSLLSDLDQGLACTHGDVIEEVLGYGLRKGAAVIVDVENGEATVEAALPAP